MPKLYQIKPNLSISMPPSTLTKSLFFAILSDVLSQFLSSGHHSGQPWRHHEKTVRPADPDRAGGLHARRARLLVPNVPDRAAVRRLGAGCRQPRAAGSEPPCDHRCSNPPGSGGAGRHAGVRGVHPQAHCCERRHPARGSDHQHQRPHRRPGAPAAARLRRRRTSAR